MRSIAWVHQIHATGGGKQLHHGDGVLCCLSSKKGERKRVVCVAESIRAGLLSNGAVVRVVARKVTLV